VPVHLDRSQLNVTACAVAAGRHQIGKAHFIHLAQVRIRTQISLFELPGLLTVTTRIGSSFTLAATEFPIATIRC